MLLAGVQGLIAPTREQYIDTAVRLLTNDTLHSAVVDAVRTVNFSRLSSKEEAAAYVRVFKHVIAASHDDYDGSVGARVFV